MTGGLLLLGLALYGLPASVVRQSQPAPPEIVDVVFGALALPDFVDNVSVRLSEGQITMTAAKTLLQERVRALFDGAQLESRLRSIQADWPPDWGDAFSDLVSQREAPAAAAIVGRGVGEVRIRRLVVKEMSLHGPADVESLYAVYPFKGMSAADLKARLKQGPAWGLDLHVVCLMEFVFSLRQAGGSWKIDKISTKPLISAFTITE